MSLLEVANVYHALTQDLLARLDMSEVRLSNLRRMEIEYLEIINKRATEDSVAVQTMFTQLRHVEETAIVTIKKQLHKDDEIDDAHL